jgi:hypothetical protein
MMSDQGEVTLLNRDQVTITTKRAIFYGTTYPVQSLTAVGVERSSGTSGCFFVIGLILAAIGGVLLISGIAMAPNASDAVGPVIVIVLALILLAPGVLIARWALRMKPTYSVRLSTSGMQTTALTSADEELPNAVAAALNEAIIRRG